MQASGSLNYKHKELLTTMRRYCSNAFTDAAKQDAMNLFLGRQPQAMRAVGRQLYRKAHLG